MKKLIAGNFRFAGSIVFRAQLILLTLLPALCCAGREHSPKTEVSQMTRDTLLLRQYTNAAGNPFISHDSANALLRGALALARKHDMKRVLGLIWNTMGGNMLQQGDFDGCKRYLDSALAINEQLKDPKLTCVLNTHAALMYQYSSNYAKAASHYFQAIRAVRQNDSIDLQSIVILYHDVGGLMSTMHEDSLAEHYLLLARKYALKMRPVDSTMLTNILITLAQTKTDLDSLAALDYYRDAYKISKRLRSAELAYTVLINLSQSYLVQQRYDSAEHYLAMAREITLPGIFQIKTEAVSGTLALSKKNYNSAIMHYNRALGFTNGEVYENLKEIYGGLAQAYAAKGFYKKAAEFQKKYTDHYEKLTANAEKTVADFMLSFQALEYEKDLNQKKAEISFREISIRRKNFWIATMCLVSGLLCIILIMAYRNYRNRKSLLSQQMRALLQDQEIERLKAEAEGADKERSRIAYDIHDGVLVRLANVKLNLGGPTLALPGLAGNSRYDEIVEQLDLATRELRNTAHNLMPEILLEEGMAQAIFYFCKATEQASGLNIKFQQVGASFPRLQSQTETAIYRIVQGLIQNIIQHAKATVTLVQLQYADYLCSITVEDNGQGMDNSANEEGYGLKSIRNRIKILRGTLDIETEKGHGTTVYFEFDVRPFLQHPIVSD